MFLKSREREKNFIVVDNTKKEFPDRSMVV